MSVYLNIDGEDGEQLASNKGWSDFCEWVEGLDVDAFPELSILRDHGWTQEIPAMLAELDKAVAESPPSDEVPGLAATIKALRDACASNKDAEVFTIGDGFAAAEAEEAAS